MKTKFLKGVLGLSIIGLFGFSLSFDSEEALASNCPPPLMGHFALDGALICNGIGNYNCGTPPCPDGDGGGPDSTPIQ